MMSDEPSYPNDAPVGGKALKAEQHRQRRKKQLIGAGIGSAAIVAALLYANRGRRSERGND
jgi:hypothetical protein